MVATDTSLICFNFESFEKKNSEVYAYNALSFKRKKVMELTKHSRKLVFRVLFYWYFENFDVNLIYNETQNKWNKYIVPI